MGGTSTRSSSVLLATVVAVGTRWSTAVAGGAVGDFVDSHAVTDAGRPQIFSAGDEDKMPGCRVAVCLSGHIRSFVHPVVHRSIRSNLIEAIEADGCEVDVFAYATLGDTVASIKQVLCVHKAQQRHSSQSAAVFVEI